MSNNNREPTKVALFKSHSDLERIVLTAFPVREGWHCCPPCGSQQPVYATPRDAALAHARIILGMTDANDIGIKG